MLAGELAIERKAVVYAAMKSRISQKNFSVWIAVKHRLKNRRRPKQSDAQKGCVDAVAKRCLGKDNALSAESGSVVIMLSVEPKAKLSKVSYKKKAVDAPDADASLIVQNILIWTI